jgi:hypothetical protein
MITIRFIRYTLKFAVLLAVAALASQEFALADETVQMSMSKRKSPLIRPPKIAVTDLAYDEKVKEHFVNFEYHGKYKRKSSSGGDSKLAQSSSLDVSDHDMASSEEMSMSSEENNRGSHSSASSEESMKYAEGVKTTIERGELRKFTADVKGELRKAGYRLVQGKPFTQKDTENLYDIVDRIKQGYYPGADYVLFGSINNVEFRRDDNPIQGSDAFSHTLSLGLVAEFSLISTRDYEIVAAFSAMGDGSDMKMSKPTAENERRTASITLNRSKVVQEVSRSLGVAVAREVLAQFDEDINPDASVSEEKTIIYKKN